MRTFDYSRAESVDEALGLLAENGSTHGSGNASGTAPATRRAASTATAEDGAHRTQTDPDGDDRADLGHGGVRPLAGGTDLLTLMKLDVARPDRLVDLKHTGLPSGVEETSDGVTIGALTTLSEIERHPLLRERYPALAEAVADAATPQLRNMATLGGNLLQRPRCWYYRNQYVSCWLKGGDACPARDGENQRHALFASGPCVAVHPSDPATALLALDAAVRLRGPHGERSVPVRDLYAEPVDDRRTETTVAPDELIVAVSLPAADMRSIYVKAMDRKVWAFALVSVAAALRLQGGTIAEARLALGGVAPIPWRVEAAERTLVGSALDDAAIQRATDAALSGAQPLEHNGYKLPLLAALIRRALIALADDSSG